jgi:hypothetical protein
VTLAMAGAGAVIYVFMSSYFVQRNKKRRDGDEDALIAGMSDDKIAEKGDENPRYVFTY